jgi:hypothetical protein
VTVVKSSTPVLDASGAPAPGRVVRVYRRDTGALIANGLTSDGLPRTEEFLWSPTGNSTGWSGYTLRTITPPSSAGGSSVKVSISAATGTGSAIMQIGAVYVGIKAATGDAYEFADTPVQAFFSGAPGIVADANAVVQTDEVALTVPAGASVVVAVYFSGTTTLRAGPIPSGWGSFYQSGNSAATVNPSGYTDGGSTAWGTTKVEIAAPPIATGMYEVQCGSFTGEVNAICLDDSAGDTYNDQILRTTPV